uniref:Uncharacterized protein n=1 Tax=Anguilla anguilla TaxID=7936 RepID=A0A0E9Q6U1_ANGAN
MKCGRLPPTYLSQLKVGAFYSLYMYICCTFNATGI